MSKNKVVCTLIFAASAAVFLAQNIAYFLRNPQFVDQFSSIWFLSGILQSRLPFLAGLKESLFSESFYPPYPFFAFHLLVRAVGFNLWVFRCLNWLYWLSGALLCALVARSVTKGVFGCTAAAFLLLSGASVTLAKSIPLEAPFLVLVPAVIYAVHRSQHFQNRPLSMAAGALTGLGLLVKWSFPAYVVGFIVPFAIVGLVRHRRTALLNIALFAVAASAVAGWWYVLGFDLKNFIACAQNDPSPGAGSFMRTFTANMKLLELLWNPQSLYLALAVIALAAVFSRSLLFFGVLLSAAASMAIFSLPGHFEDRYILPLVPMLSILVAISLHTLARPLGKLASYLLLGGMMSLFLLGASDSYWFKGAPESMYPGQMEPVRADGVRWYHEWNPQIAGETERLAASLCAELRRQELSLIIPPLLQGKSGLSSLRILLEKIAYPSSYPHLHYHRFDTFEYVKFHRRLQDGEFDLLLLSRNYLRHYLSLDELSPQHPLYHQIQRGYVAQTTSEYLPPPTFEMIRDDMRTIDENYRIVEVLFFPATDAVEIRLRRDLWELLGPNYKEPRVKFLRER